MEEAVVVSSEQAKKANLWQNFKWGIIGILLGGGFFLLILLGLNQLKLISFSDIFRSLPLSNLTGSKQIPPSSGPAIVIAKLTPVPTGSPFKEAVIISGTTVALFVVNGIITDIKDAPDGSGKLIYAQQDDGRAIQDGLLALKDLKPTLVTVKNNQDTESSISLKDIKKGDTAVISYNFDIQTGKGKIAAIRITRMVK